MTEIVDVLVGREKVRDYLPVALPLLLVACLLGIIGAVDPVMLGVVAVAVVLIIAGVLLLRQPQKALMFSFLLIFLSETKFRVRDSRALLTGDIDAQIIYELASYSFVFLITLLNLRSCPRKYLKPTPVELALFGYVILSLFSVFWSYTPRITIVRATQLFILCIFSFVSVRMLGPQRVLRMLVVTLVLFVLLFSLMALLFPWASGTQVDYLGVSRFSWFAIHPVLAAAHAAEASILIISEALFAPGSWRRRMMEVPLWLYIVPLGLVLLAARSRGPLLAFVAAVVVLWMKRYVNSRVVVFAGYMMLVPSVILLGFYFHLSRAMEDFLGGGGLLSAFLLRGQTLEVFLSVTGRTALWRDIYVLVLEHPLLGYGYGASRSFLLDVLPWASHAHNALMQTLLNVGIVGTALVWFALGRTLLSSFFQIPLGPFAWRQACIFGLLAFLLVHSFSHDTFAAFPGYDPLLFFAAVFAHERLRLLARPPERHANAIIQSPDRPQQRLYYQTG